MVKTVEVTGLTRTSAAYVQDVARIRAGEPADSAALDEAVTRLLQTGRFLTAVYRVEPVDGGVAVVFDVRERPVITAIRFEGNAKIRSGKLEDEIALKVGQPVDLFAIRDGRESIAAKYRDAGYGDVVVTFDQPRVENTGELIYTIEEGPRVRIRKITFEGNATISDEELRSRIDTKTAFWFFRTGAFDAAKIEADAAQLRQHYHDQGFLDARVSFRKAPEKDGDGLAVFFTIDEGTRYRIESITLRGQTVYSEEELSQRISSQVGGIVKQPQLDADAKSIRTLYGEQGYIDAEVRVTRVFSDTPGLVHVSLEIKEGEQFRVGRVTVRGNARTQDKVVRRALKLFPPDGLFNLTEAREAERRLLETQIFSAARVVPVGDRPGVRDAVIDVEESEKSGDFLFGAGITSNNGLVGNVVLDFRNFDILDRPRSWSEFLKLRSFSGAGQRMRFELQPGTEVSRYRIDFTEPYLFDKPLRLDVSLYLFERDRDGYTEARIGSGVSLGKRFEQGRLKDWSGEVALRLEDVDVDDVDLFASNEIREDEGSNLLTSVKATLVRDRTDNRFVPSSGGRFRVGYEQFGALGGDHFFGKLTSGYTWYTTVYTDQRERKSIVQLSAEGGVLAGDAPVFERFYAGGVGSVRGFEYRGIGPRDGIDDNNVGGEFLALASGEYSFPLIGETFRGLVFLDSGTAGDGPWRVAVGAGVRMTLNLRGPIPLEFAVGFPLVEDEDDDDQLFSFSIGGLFHRGG